MRYWNYVYSLDTENLHFVDDERLSAARNRQEAEDIARLIMDENDKQEISIATAYRVNTFDIIPPNIGEKIIEIINDYISDELQGKDSDLINVGMGSQEKLDLLVRMTIDHWLEVNGLEPKFKFLDEYITITRGGEI